MTIKPTIVFDLDGTLADTVDDLLAALNRTLARSDLAPMTRDDFERLSEIDGLRGMIAYAFEAEQRPLDGQQLRLQFAETVKDYSANIAVDTKLFPNVREVLEKFKKRDWILAVCTNKPFLQSKLLLQELEIDGFFSAVKGGDSFSVKKPDPLHLLWTIADAGGQSSNAVMVGDTRTDIQTAKNARVRSIAIEHGYSQTHVGEFSPDIVISSMDDLLSVVVGLVD